MNAERMEVAQAAEQLTQVLERVNESHWLVVLVQAGREVGAILPIAAYRTLLGERTARAEAFRRAGESMPDYPEDEVERDIAEALAAVRRERRSLDETAPGER